MNGAEFVSEPVKPDAGSADAAAMATGVPGLPAGFVWREQHYEICELLASWKHSEPYNHRAGGDRYYRKHYFKVRVATGEVMTLYALRHMKSGENARKRWWLQLIERE